MEKINAVVVTYNRKDLLMECINAILAQTYPVDKLIIIDNNSTDGTEDFLLERGYLCRSEVQYKKLAQNVGGAGGFYEGMKQAKNNDCSWAWIMDDDTIPTPTCLEELVTAKNLIDGKISFLASSIFGINSEAMNVPKINRSQFSEYVDWYEYLGQGIVKIVKATFVSLLINADAIKQCGYPWKEFFLWGDDSEYTQRIIRDYGPAYMVGKSVAIHKRAGSEALSIIKEKNPSRIEKYFYYYRNNLIGFWEYENIAYRFLCVGKMGYDFLGVLFKGKYKFKKMWIILKAFGAFVFGTYDRKSFKNRERL